MFKIFVVSALLLVLSIEATNWACKSEVSPALGGICPDEQILVGDGCCEKDDAFDVDAYECKSEPLPAVGGFCPYGFLLVADGCCPNSDAVQKKQ